MQVNSTFIHYAACNLLDQEFNYIFVYSSNLLIFNSYLPIFLHLLIYSQHMNGVSFNMENVSEI